MASQTTAVPQDVFTFQEGPLGMTFGGFISDGCATVRVEDVLPGSQAARLGVRTGAVLRTIGEESVLRIDSMSQVVSMITNSSRPLSITMAVPELEAAAQSVPRKQPAPSLRDSDRGAGSWRKKKKHPGEVTNVGGTTLFTSDTEEGTVPVQV